MNTNIINTGIIPKVASGMISEEEFKKKCSEDTEKMLKTFTFEENMMIAFVPLIISHIAWRYAEKAMNYCRDRRIDEFKKPSREIHKLREEYLSDLSKDLDRKHLEEIFNETDRFLEEVSRDFTILYFSVNGEIKKLYPNIGHDEMRSNAYISVAMIQFLKAHNRRMDELIAEKMQRSASIENPIMRKLASYMTLYSGNIKLDNSQHLKACVNILQKNINKIQFNFV